MNTKTVFSMMILSMLLFGCITVSDIINTKVIENKTISKNTSEGVKTPEPEFSVVSPEEGTIFIAEKGSGTVDLLIEQTGVDFKNMKYLVYIDGKLATEMKDTGATMHLGVGSHILKVVLVSDDGKEFGSQTVVFSVEGSKKTGDSFEVAISERHMNKEMLSIGVGDLVEWTNNEEFPHIIRIEKGGKTIETSPPLEKGKTFKHIFTEPGEYRIYSVMSPQTEMSITVK